MQDNAPKPWTPSSEWERKLKELTWSFGNDDVRFRHEEWRQVFEKQLDTSPFSIHAANPLFSLPLGEGCAKWTHWLSREATWDRYRTLSQFAVLQGEESAVGQQSFENKKSKYLRYTLHAEHEAKAPEDYVSTRCGTKRRWLLCCAWTNILCLDNCHTRCVAWLAGSLNLCNGDFRT